MAKYMLIRRLGEPIEITQVEVEFDERLTRPWIILWLKVPVDLSKLTPYNVSVGFSIYIHFPYCRTKCCYCDFFSVTDMSSLEVYHDALLREIDYFSRDIRFRGGTIETVFFGGGTPSLSNPNQIDKTLKALWQQFDRSDDTEITLEANPDDITDRLASTWRDSGINRISIGAQSLHDSELEFLGRRHSSDAVVQSCEILRKLGFQNISLDLIYGIPGQTMQSWEETMGKAVALGPTHLSAYCLTVEQGTPLQRMVRDGEARLPDDGLLREMYILAVEGLAIEGYQQYEISNFALPGCECRHNLTYWTGGAYLGIGAAAASYFHPARWKNVSDIGRYVSEVRSKGCGIGESELIDLETRRRELIMLSLRLTSGLDCDNYAREFGDDICQSHADSIALLVDNGMMECREGRLLLTPAGMFVSDDIINRLT